MDSESEILLLGTRKTTLWSSLFSAKTLVVAAMTVGVVVACVYGLAEGGSPTPVSSGPEQVMLLPMGPDSFAITWVIPVGARYTPLSAPYPSRSAGYAPPVVVNSGLPPVSPRIEYGTRVDALTSIVSAEMTSYEYRGGSDWRGVRSNASSPLLFSAIATGLPPGGTFYYRCGDDANGFSPVTAAVALPPVGTAGVRVAVLGDLGTTVNSSSTVDHVLARHAAVPFAGILHAGDLSYAELVLEVGG